MSQRDTPWNRAVGFPASLMRHADRMAEQHRRAIAQADREYGIADILQRQVLPAGDPRDPREVGR